MKTISTLNKLWWFPMLGRIIGCQRGTEIKKTSYQTAASVQVAKMVAGIDKVVRNAKKSSSTHAASSVRTSYGQFDMWGTSPWAGQYLPNNVDQVSAQFQGMMAQINNAMTNEQALAAGIRAVNNIFTNGNPQTVTAYQYTDSFTQQGLAYLNAWTMPGATYGGFIGNVANVAPYTGFLGSGFLDLPRY